MKIFQINRNKNSNINTIHKNSIIQNFFLKNNIFSRFFSNSFNVETKRIISNQKTNHNQIKFDKKYILEKTNLNIKQKQFPDYHTELVNNELEKFNISLVNKYQEFLIYNFSNRKINLFLNYRFCNNILAKTILSSLIIYSKSLNSQQRKYLSNIIIYVFKKLKNIF